MNNYIDTSSKSLIIAGVVFVVTAIIAKFVLSEKEKDEEDKRSIYLTLLYSVIIGLICALISLALYKQYCKFGTCDILTDPFPTR